MDFSNEIAIRRDVETVFAYVADLENLPSWNYAIARTVPISGPGRGEPPHLGARYRQLRTLPRPMEEELQIVTYEPPELLAVSGGFGPFHGTATYTFNSAGETTVLVNDVSLSASGVLTPAAWLARGAVRRAVAQNLAALAQILEHR